MKTFVTKMKDIKRKWYLIDASGLVLGRLATRVANLLRGKGKPYYTPNLDTGDFVIVVNAGKVRLTGKKLQQKTVFSHSGYPGGTKFMRYDKLMATHPERAIRKAVKGMLPQNKLSNKQITKLKVYRGSEHDHNAQKPERIEIK